MSCYIFIFFSIICRINYAESIALLETPSFSGSDNADSEIYQILNSKGYLPNEDDLPKATVLKKDDNDATYILSKLSDEELINLLQGPKRNEYDLNDIIKVASNTKAGKTLPSDDKTGFLVSKKKDTQTAFFRLEDKEVEPFTSNNEGDPKYRALQKLSNLLYSRPQHQSSDEDDDKNEMLFDVLVAQLKSLCCKKSEPKANTMDKLKTLLKKIITSKKSKLSQKKISPKGKKPTEHIFLVINDEIKSQNDSEELIAVDPESLSKNSSVLVLGPIVTPLSEVQLKLVISRIATELSKSEYMPLLQKISEGVLENSNLGLMKSLITGPDSRRYIKPHRCNHQSKLARVYGGPKWLICTGYLNINTPSLYD